MSPFISPNHRLEEFPRGLSLEDKIAVFADRVWGWQLNIAEQVARDIKDSGFAVLSIVLSYFEMIAKYCAGYIDIYESEHYFKEGVKLVFPELSSGEGQEAINALLLGLYRQVRCGMYHNALTHGTVELSGDIGTPIEFVSDQGWIRINPHLLVKAIKNHFYAYLNGTLKDPDRVKDDVTWRHVQ